VENLRKSASSAGNLFILFHATWYYIDLGVQKILAAEKDNHKIAVEIKSFVGAWEMNDLENALGQFIFYRSILSETEPERELFLFFRQQFSNIFLDFFFRPAGTGTDIADNSLAVN
jgi:hypothetical protein